VTSGASTGGVSGSLTLGSGDSVDGASGSVDVVGGSSSTSSCASVSVRGGSSGGSSSVGGSVSLESGQCDERHRYAVECGCDGLERERRVE
jgi:hypothetical protein